MDEPTTRIPIRLFLEDAPQRGHARIVAVSDGGVELALFDVDKRLFNFPFVCMTIDFDDRSKPKAEPEVGGRPQPAKTK